MAGINASKLLFNYQYFHFNHLQRAWETTIVRKNSLISTLENCDGESVFKLSKTNQDLKRVYSYPENNERITYDVLKNLQLYSSCIKFEIDGDLNIDVGHVIQLSQGSSKTNKLLNGRWVITRVIHTFYQTNYKTVMECARTMRMKDN